MREKEGERRAREREKYEKMREGQSESEQRREEERKRKRVKINKFYRVSFPLVQYLFTLKRISIDRANVLDKYLLCSSVRLSRQSSLSAEMK